MDRSRRNSLHGESGNIVISTLRDKIKSLEDKRGRQMDLVDPMRFGAIVHQEQILINKRTKTVRRAYMVDHRYKVGWVVDWDVDQCMVCSQPFGWLLGRPKHHCRACGALVCHSCSPYVTMVPGLNEFGGSRVCIDCFGLKPGVLANPALNRSTTTSRASEYHKNSPLPSPGNSFSRRHSESGPGHISSAASVASEESPANGVRRHRSARRQSGGNAGIAGVGGVSDMLGMTEDDINSELRRYEEEQLPFYLQDYLKMREFVPLDIYKTTIQRMVEQGLTQNVANRIWACKALWLICTHPEDIKKIHLADFRGKYSTEGLDVRELRAIWYNLPVWDENSSNPLEVGKAEWRAGFKSRMDNQIYKMAAGTLPEHLKINPVYEECELKHVFDPTIPLRTRYERSASQHQHAIESPLDANPYSDSLRTQQKPHKVAKGLVQAKTRAYLSNYEDTPGQLEDISEYYDEDEEVMDGDYLDEEGEEYVYEYEEGDSKLDEYLDEEPIHVAGNRSNAKRGKGISGRFKKPYPGLIDEINAEVVSDLEEDEGTDSYSYQQPPPHHGEVDDTVLQTYVPYHGRSPGQVNTKQQNYGTSNNSIRSDRSGRSGGGGSSQGISDNHSHGSFRFRSTDAYNAAHVTPPPHEPVNRISQHGREKHNSNTAASVSVSNSSGGGTGGSLANSRSPQRSVGAIGTPQTFQGESRIPFHGNAPSPKHSSGAGDTHGSGGSSGVAANAGRRSLGGGISPTPSTRTVSPVPSVQSLTAVPAYVHNQPNTFVPRRSPVPTSPIRSTVRSNSGQYVSAETSSGPGTGNGVNGFSHGNYELERTSSYSARRMEREQARRMRSAAARAETEGYDQEGLLVDNDGIQGYGVHSPTSSLSSHNDSTSQSIPRVGSGAALPSAAAQPPFQQQQHGYIGDGGNVTSSEASTERGLPQRAAVPTTPSKVAAPQNSDVLNVVPEGETVLNEQGEQDFENSGSEGSGSYLSEDDDLSFNTAEEMNTPMLQRGSQAPKATVRTGRRGRTPRTTHGNNRAKGNHSAVVDVAQAREELIGHLMVGDANRVTEVLKTVYNAEPVIPLSDLIKPAQSSVLMMQCFKEPGSLIHADQTLKVLLDTLGADVNHIESETGMTLLHYMVEQDEKKLGKILVSKGADILIEDCNKVNPLALSLSKGIEWLLEEFQNSGRQARLLESNNIVGKLKYATVLIFAGHSALAADVIRDGGLTITPEDASQLFASCRGNFERMKDPIATFELLESLGATY